MAPSRASGYPPDPLSPTPIPALTVSGASGAKFPCSQSVTDCLAGLESATPDDVAAGTVRLTVDGLRHCSFPALSTGESRPGWKGWFCGAMVCFSIGGWTGTKWSLRGSPGSIRNIRENLCGVFLPPAGYAGRFGGDRVRDSWRTAFPGFLRSVGKFFPGRLISPSILPVHYRSAVPTLLFCAASLLP